MEWTTEDSNRLYQIDRWGEGHFEINREGHLCVNPEGRRGGPVIDMAQVVAEIKDRGLSFPVVVRFHDILWAKVEGLNKTFRKVIATENYRGLYKGVYPVKVNQMREVVEEILEAGRPYDYGLEAGSKAELEAVLALNTNENSLTILNGHKDDEYLRLALLGKRLGHKVIIVLERPAELTRLLRIRKEMGIEPVIGLRINLALRPVGRWQDSSGEHSQFGLMVPEILEAVEIMGREGLLNACKLLHFHMGSQVTDIKCFKDAVVEATRIYAKLRGLGVNIEYMDVGGGLGVDYDGGRSTNHSSKNYSLIEYVTDIVWGIKTICDQEGVPHPHIVSESGRAVTAQHSCVISNVVDVISPKYEGVTIHKKEGEHHLVATARENLEILEEDNYQEVYNDNAKMKEDALNAFKLGILSLEEYAVIEAIIWRVNRGVVSLMKKKDFIPEALEDLEERIAPKYLFNFSVFQSAADHWAIDQILPVAPLMRLHEKPTERCALVDITCDSDGRLKYFLDSGEIKKTIPLHPIREGEEYFVGLFLTGAYQDVMGDMHNLFGRPHEVHVFQHDDAQGFYFEEVIPGPSAGGVLSTMQYVPGQLVYTVKKKIDKMVREGAMGPREGLRLSDLYEKALGSYTYLR